MCYARQLTRRRWRRDHQELPRNAQPCRADQDERIIHGDRHILRGMFGAIFAFTIGERIGRKKAILLGTTVMAMGQTLQTTSFSLPQMFVGRIILG